MDVLNTTEFHAKQEGKRYNKMGVPATPGEARRLAERNLRTKLALDDVNVPEEVVQYLVNRPDGLHIQCEQVASLLRQRVITATVTTAPTSLRVRVAASQPPAATSLPYVATELPKFSGFNDLQLPGVFLGR